MLTYNFSDIGSDSLYIHLYKCIKKDIKEGKLKAGEKLPSKRALAKNLGISVITVEGAYEQLVSEGFVYSMPKRGFYIADIQELAGQATLFEHQEDNSIQQGILAERVKLTGGDNGYLADFTSNQTEMDMFPFTVWTKTVREVLNDSQLQLMTNSPCGGILELRASIANYLKEFRGMVVYPEQVIVGAGTEYLYGLLIQLFGKGKRYAVEDPGYSKIAKIYQSMGVDVSYVPMDEAGILPEKLEEAKCSIVHISPSHHFPTGIVMPISRRYELLGWANQEDGRYIIEDDYDSELRLTGKPIPTLQSIDVSERVIYMNTFTKTLSSTVRISYMVLPPKLLEEFYARLSFYSCTVSNFEQYTLARFMQNGSFEKHVNRLRSFYQRKRDIIVGALTRGKIGKYISIDGEEAGVHFLMHVTSKKTEEEILKLAKAKGIRLATLAGYYVNGKADKDTELAFVMNYSSIDVEKIEQIAEALYQVVR